MLPLSAGWPELFPESIAACCSPSVLKEKEGMQSLFKQTLCQLPPRGNSCRGVLLYFQIFAFPHTEAQIQHSKSTSYPHKQHGPLHSVLVYMCNTNIALKILIPYVFNTTWGKVPQMCLASPGRMFLALHIACGDSLLTGFHLQQSWKCWGSFFPNGRSRLLQGVSGNWTSNLQTFHGRPFLTKKKWKHSLSQARLN